MIQLNHVYKTFFKGKDTEVHALDDVTMTVKDGDFVTITGPSGSGKSTLMRVVEGMECADQGNCILNGIDLAKSSDKKRAEIRNQKMGIVLQDFGLFNDQTVKQNLQLPFLIAKRSIKSANIRAQEILEYLHIAELTNRKVQTLSCLLYTSTVGIRAHYMMQKKPKAGHITELTVGEYRILEDPFEWNISFRKDENCEWLQWKISKSDWNPSAGVPKVLYVREEDLLLLDKE